ncbi:cellulase family glycosylhydrolase [Jatrophihabitans sp.]|uniref:cellulase family glycosylhydrolase n=1 Tax=Jatrophihabitans sp. TaxID=1932789 RepID=UPI0030C71D45|nr:beta-mannosidase [Jatrophihabitans sp.]
MLPPSTRTRSLRSRILVIAACLVALVSSLVVTATSASADPPAVTASSTGLLLNGQAWWPAGVDAYELSTNWSVNAGCGAMVDLNSFFASQPAHSLVRFDAYQAMAINKNTGALDFSALDAVFAAAAAHSVYVLPVLAPQDGGCDNGVFKSESWYQTGWQQVLGTSNVMSFQSWVTTAVNRWKSNRYVAGWELVGEPEDPICGDPTCNWATNTCPPDAATVLRSFMDTAGAQVRALDSQHLIFAGFTGGGQCGTGYTDYQYVAASPGIDVLEYHDYGADGVPLPGDQWNGLAERISQAQALGKPLLVAEVGENAGSCESLATRSAHFQTKIEGQRAAGTAGVLAWDWVPDPRTDQCTYDIGPGDPALTMLAAHNTLG